MGISNEQQTLLKKLPGVDSILELVKSIPSLEDTPKTLVADVIRNVILSRRQSILDPETSITSDDLLPETILEVVLDGIQKKMALNLTRTINATGVVVHTNLGRSLLSDKALSHVVETAGRYSNLEFNISTGKRGLRYSAVEDIICEISGAESAMVVNNNAAAVLLCLDTIARGKEVIVSRGELVEIGGSFRIPDVMAKSGGILKEVGTTNRTHLRDYRSAINESTGLLLKVHTSNYSVVGFTASVPLDDMVSLGREHGIPVMDDLGSGTFIDFSDYGLTREPTVQDSVSAGTDIVTFSGDKLLGGPQAGIIVGRREIIESIRGNPLTRALRVDKMTLAGLESTLRLYRDPVKAVQTIPTLRMLTMSRETTVSIAEMVVSQLKSIESDKITIELTDSASKAGGGSLPLLELPSCCVGISIKGMSANTIERKLRTGNIPVIGRIEDDIFLIDPRTLQADEPELIKTAFADLLEESDK